MNMRNQYRSAIREKLNTLGRIVTETEDSISVMVDDTKEETYRRVVQLLPSQTEINIAPRDEGMLVQVNFAEVTNLNE